MAKPREDTVMIPAAEIRAAVRATGSTYAAVCAAPGHGPSYLVNLIRDRRPLARRDWETIQELVRDPSGLPAHQKPGPVAAPAPRTMASPGGGGGRIERRIGCGEHRWHELRRGRRQIILQCRACGQYQTMHIRETAG